jgi:hypothetical protein
MALKFGCPSFAAWEDYKEILAASYSDEFFRSTQDYFWGSASSAFLGQSRFLVLLWLFSYLEGCVFLLLVRNYGRWRDSYSLYDWIVKRLLASVSEWYLLLTTVNFPPEPERRVAADLLTAEDHLYQGFIGDYFLDSDGELSGVLLTEPRRFDRQGYLVAKEKDPNTKPESFWREIPGYNLYLPRDKVLSVNLRYPLKDDASAAGTAAAATEELVEEGLQIRIEPVEGPQEPEVKNDEG